MNKFTGRVNLDNLQAFVESLGGKAWSGDADEKNFLEFLLNYVHNNKKHSINSERIDYCCPEFERNYLKALSFKVFKYAKENYIDREVKINQEKDDIYADLFVESSCVLKIKKNFYLIQELVGQRSLVYFEYLKDDNNFKSYVDYDLMMKGEKSPNYEEDLIRHERKLENAVYKQLDRIKADFDINDEEFIQILNKYAQK